MALANGTAWCEGICDTVDDPFDTTLGRKKPYYDPVRAEVIVNLGERTFVPPLPTGDISGRNTDWLKEGYMEGRDVHHRTLAAAMHKRDMMLDVGVYEGLDQTPMLGYIAESAVLAYDYAWRASDNYDPADGPSRPLLPNDADCCHPNACGASCANNCLTCCIPPSCDRHTPQDCVEMLCCQPRIASAYTVINCFGKDDDDPSALDRVRQELDLNEDVAVDIERLHLPVGVADQLGIDHHGLLAKFSFSDDDHDAADAWRLGSEYSGFLAELLEARRVDQGRTETKQHMQRVSARHRKGSKSSYTSSIPTSSHAATLPDEARRSDDVRGDAPGVNETSFGGASLAVEGQNATNDADDATTHSASDGVTAPVDISDAKTPSEPVDDTGNQGTFASHEETHEPKESPDGAPADNASASTNTAIIPGQLGSHEDADDADDAGNVPETQVATSNPDADHLAEGIAEDRREGEAAPQQSRYMEILVAHVKELLIAYGLKQDLLDHFKLQLGIKTYQLWMNETTEPPRNEREHRYIILTQLIVQKFRNMYNARRFIEILKLHTKYQVHREFRRAASVKLCQMYLIGRGILDLKRFLADLKNAYETDRRIVPAEVLQLDSEIRRMTWKRMLDTTDFEDRHHRIAYDRLSAKQRRSIDDPSGIKNRRKETNLDTLKKFGIMYGAVRAHAVDTALQLWEQKTLELLLSTVNFASDGYFIFHLVRQDLRLIPHDWEPSISFSKRSVDEDRETMYLLGFYVVLLTLAVRLVMLLVMYNPFQGQWCRQECRGMVNEEIGRKDPMLFDYDNFDNTCGAKLLLLLVVWPVYLVHPVLGEQLARRFSRTDPHTLMQYHTNLREFNATHGGQLHHVAESRASTREAFLANFEDRMLRDRAIAELVIKLGHDPTHLLVTIFAIYVGVVPTDTLTDKVTLATVIVSSLGSLSQSVYAGLRFCRARRQIFSADEWWDEIRTLSSYFPFNLHAHADE
eukprot:m.833862 g.833862  ORF g.833862 m.833862 type:complete len:977 (-) comp23442_c0_seq50:1438-4368(-)